MNWFKLLAFLIISFPFSMIYSQTLTSSISTPFGATLFEGTVYVSQSYYSRFSKAIIQIKIPEPDNDYMPIVFYNEQISIKYVGKRVYFNLYIENGIFYADNLSYSKPTSYNPISREVINQLIENNCIDIHNTIEGVDHAKSLTNIFQISTHRIGHLWNAKFTDKTREQSRRLSTNKTSDYSRFTTGSLTRLYTSPFKFSIEELAMYGLQEICYNDKNEADCSSIWYINKSLYNMNLKLFKSSVPLFFKKENTSLNGIKFQLITDVSLKHRH